jgi:hypothetical protein
MRHDKSVRDGTRGEAGLVSTVDPNPAIAAVLTKKSPAMRILARWAALGRSDDHPLPAKLAQDYDPGPVDVKHEPSAGTYF